MNPPGLRGPLRPRSGSRAIGGQKPTDERLYGQIESADYLTPDTQQEEAYQRTFTPQMRRRRRFFIWGLYACCPRRPGAVKRHSRFPM